MKTVELTLCVAEEPREMLVAALADLDCYAFVHEADSLKAYLPADQWNAAKRTLVERWLADAGGTLTEHHIEPQNWNEQWERSIQPLAVGPFLIKPTWAAPPPAHADKIVLEIDPKMSFGTGYHESTRLVLRLLPTLITGGERVLDAGTGTGILAIAAVKLGAGAALAFDPDPWTFDNARENIALNGVAAQVTFRPGTLADVPETGFDLILANINRSVLLELLPAFAEKSRPGGHVILAGLLQTDRPLILEAAADTALTPDREATENEWWSVVFRK